MVLAARARDEPTFPGCLITARAIGMFQMNDETDLCLLMINTSQHNQRRPDESAGSPV